MITFSHLSEVCMTYRQHLIFSSMISFKLFCGSVKALVHAIIPSFFAKSSTLLLKEVQDDIENSGCQD